MKLCLGRGVSILLEHPSSREMFSYWNELRGRRIAPERNEIDPAAIRKALGDSIVLSSREKTGHPIQLAGTRVCALFRRELKERPFVTLWHANSRPLLRSLVASVAEHGLAIVVGGVGRTGTDESVPIEMLLLPLAQCFSPADQFLGVLAPLAVPEWIGIRPIEALVLGASLPPNSALPRGNRRPPVRLVVYEGGAARI